MVEPHVLRTGERSAHHEPRVTLVGLPVGREHVAEHPPDLVLAAPPGKQLERGRIGHGDHVRLLDPVEPGDRRAVESHALLERLVELVLADGEGLERAEDVREPEPDELDVLLLDARDHVARVQALPFLDGGHQAGTSCESWA